MSGSLFNFIKKRLQHKCFPVNIGKFLRVVFFYRAPLIAGSGYCDHCVIAL